MQEQEYIAKITALMTDGQLAAAKALIEDAFNVFPASGFICFLKAAIYAQEQHYDLAKKAYSESISLSPDLYIARFQLGLLQATLEEYDDAVQSLHPLLNTEHEYLPLFANALICIFQGDNSNAIISIEEGIQRNTDNPNLNKDMREMLDRINGASAEQQANADTISDDSAHADEINDGATAEQDKSHLLDIYDVKH
ncbi:hypothetical protein [Agaribacter marinus]|uniref:Tetratricopeptide repeat protein n=1 Tax=Agaribacter marinus TaxID=1431249 RepID=A0AA37T0C5_9ALTE|nr:hypothetical protein [Agaribacter marinus]GLR69998.1 hypothetical protein GCM10007852_09060 [Agaribacter marinus]